jgi:hypothetical protein
MNVLLRRSARTGPPALDHFAYTGRDTCPSLLASMALLPLTVQLDLTRVLWYIQEIITILVYQSLWTSIYTLDNSYSNLKNFKYFVGKK